MADPVTTFVGNALSAAGTAAVTTFSQALNPALSAFTNNHWNVALVGLGKGILGAAFVWELASAMLEYWTYGGAQQLIGKLVRLIVITAIPLMMLTNWSSGSSLSGDLLNFTFNDVPGQLGLPTGALSSAPSAVDTGIQQMSAAYGKLMTLLWNGPSLRGSDAVGGKKVSPAQIYCNNTGDCPPGTSPPTSTINGGNDSNSKTGLFTSLKNAILNLGGKIWYTLMSLYTMFAISLCMIILTLATIFALYGPLFMLNIGMVFGPVLVAFLPLQFMRSAFTRWIDYMLTMGAAYVIGLMMAGLAGNAMQTFANGIQNAFSQSNGDYGAANVTLMTGTFPLMVSMLFLAMMALRVERIASALFGGMALEGGGAFAAMVGAKAMSMKIGGRGQKNPPPKQDQQPVPAPQSTSSGGGNMPTSLPGSNPALSGPRALPGPSGGGGSPGPGGSSGPSGGPGSGAPGGGGGPRFSGASGSSGSGTPGSGGPRFTSSTSSAGPRFGGSSQSAGTTNASGGWNPRGNSTAAQNSPKSYLGGYAAGFTVRNAANATKQAFSSAFTASSSRGGASGSSPAFSGGGSKPAWNKADAVDVAFREKR